MHALQAVAVHLWALSSSSCIPRRSPGFRPESQFVLRFEAGQVAGGWGGMGKWQKRPHLWAFCFSSQALANGLALPVPVALRHQSLVMMSHFGSCGWMLFSSEPCSCPLWLGRGQREHKGSPSRDSASELPPLLTQSSFWSTVLVMGKWGICPNEPEVLGPGLKFFPFATLL